MRLEKILQELLLKADNAKEEKEEYVPSENEQDEVSIISMDTKNPVICMKMNPVAVVGTRNARPKNVIVI